MSAGELAPSVMEF